MEGESQRVDRYDHGARVGSSTLHQACKTHLNRHCRQQTLLVRAYEYLGAYEANTTKDFTTSLEYYDKILQLEPDNNEAKRNAELLEKWIEDGKGQ